MTSTSAVVHHTLVAPPPMPNRFCHPRLGRIRGCRVSDDLVQFRGIPYARIPRRFARSHILNHLSLKDEHCDSYYDATDYGPCSIQPLDSIATDVRWNQLPECPERKQDQSEDCLRITITSPSAIIGEFSEKDRLPVVIFVHGGALMIGSGDRKYYDPISFCTEALDRSTPIIFASINYRLGACGFLHSPEADEQLPPNNGLYDQLLGFEWIRSNIVGFGGDPDNITAIGQSAGAASLSLHNSRFRSKPLYRKAIILSGSTTVLVTMTPAEHHKEFVYQVKKLGIDMQGRSMAEIATDLINAPIDAIRGLNYSGAFCSPSELIPDEDWATMRHARSTAPNNWLESQILCSSTYDGSISHLVAKGQERTQLAKIFARICQAILKNPQQLLDLYHISALDDDEVALEKICQVVTDLGFYGAAVSGLLGAAKSTVTNSYSMLFDIGNPFTTLLEKDRFATHTWDVVSLFGAYDELIPKHMLPGIRQWRDVTLSYCHSGHYPGSKWQPILQSTLLVHRDGVRNLDHEFLIESQAIKLLELAEQEGGDLGFDLLWEKVLRFFLKTGNPRYSHELREVLDDDG